jgi:hypothetical protein
MSAADAPPPPFTESDLEAIRAILADPAPVHASDPDPARRHVEHCLWQTARFAHLAAEGHAFRAAQWGLNFGRAQELLGSRGGVEAWWRAFEPLILAEDWVGLATRSHAYLALFGLPLPDEAFLNRA